MMTAIICACIKNEQEYLAEHLTKEGLFNYCKQKDFKLKDINIPDIEIKKHFGL